MEVQTASVNDFEQLVEFNSRIYPGKIIPASNYLRFWFSREGDAIEKCLILKESNGKIHGQVLASEMSYYFERKKKKTVWLFDLIVEENLRKDGWGVDLLLDCQEKHPFSCSTGSGPMALPIHLKMGNVVLGDIRKYVGITSLRSIITSIKRGILPNESFPQQVTAKGQVYNKIELNSLPDYTTPFNESLFEIARDKEFLKWRFFNNLHSYAFYKQSDSNNYFVIRTTVKKGVTIMLLVDYRCDIKEKEGFETIYNAVKEVMREMRLGFLIVGSSLQVIDSILESHLFKSLGRPRPVIGFVDIKGQEEKVNIREFALVTLADSDGETNWE